MKSVERLLIANRGEIAVRIARTAREMGIEPIGVYSESDATGFHRKHIARSVSLGPGGSRETYLSIDRILRAAAETGADALHPGYGFLSENAAFARAVEREGLLWIGPPPDSIARMADKLEARRLATAAGVPLVPGTDGSDSPSGDAELEWSARKLGFPLLVKPSAGGGGKGMVRVEKPEDLRAALEEARRVALAAFGDDRLYLEKLLERPRHIEFQIFADRQGGVVHLFERECSVQRRHQKVVEETPSAALDEDLRARMGRAAVEVARAAGYVGAGTVEFLVDEDGNFYFLEMNTRLQVEHPITEETLGLDLVRTQLEVAAGAPLPADWREGRLAPRGHAIELRLYAEDPVEFLPRAGKILVWEPPSGPGIRVDAGVEEGSVVGVEFDPLLAKLIVFASDRDAAIARALRALEEWVVLGVETNRPALVSVLSSREFLSGRYTTDILNGLELRAEGEPPDAAWIAAALALQGSFGVSTAARPPEPWDEKSGWRA